MSTIPKPRPTTRWLLRRRNRRPAATRRKRGTSRQERPRNWNPKAATSAPSGPMRFFGRTAAAVLWKTLGSIGW